MEDADLAAAQELFGSNINLDTLQPKSAKEFEDFGAALVQKYVLQHEKSPHYKALVKAVSPPCCPSAMPELMLRGICASLEVVVAIADL